MWIQICQPLFCSFLFLFSLVCDLCFPSGQKERAGDRRRAQFPSLCLGPEGTVISTVKKMKQRTYKLMRDPAGRLRGLLATFLDAGEQPGLWCGSLKVSAF
jgi:hypothetical protein